MAAYEEQMSEEEQFRQEPEPVIQSLSSEDDLEEILARAARKSGPQSGSLRERLLQAAGELGISPEALREAEVEHAQAKAEAADIAEFQRKRIADWKAHLFSYIGVNICLLAMDFFSGGGINWAFFPLLGWGIGMTIHTLSTFLQKPQDDHDYEKWQVQRELLRRRIRPR
jgi:hypothetical protein